MQSSVHFDLWVCEGTGTGFIQHGSEEAEAGGGAEAGEPIAGSTGQLMASTAVISGTGAEGDEPIADSSGVDGEAEVGELVASIAGLASSDADEPEADTVAGEPDAGEPDAETDVEAGSGAWAVIWAGVDKIEACQALAAQLAPSDQDVPVDVHMDNADRLRGENIPSSLPYGSHRSYRYQIDDYDHLIYHLCKEKSACRWYPLFSYQFRNSLSNHLETNPISLAD